MIAAILRRVRAFLDRISWGECARPYECGCCGETLPCRRARRHPGECHYAADGRGR